MAMKHKDEDLSAGARTSLTVEKLHDICRQAAEEARGGFLQGTRIKVTHGENATLQLAVSGPGGISTIMLGRVMIEDDRGGERRVISTHIGEALVAQERFLMFIPMGRKKMPALHILKDFNRRICALVAADDPDAKISEDTRSLSLQ